MKDFFEENDDESDYINNEIVNDLLKEEFGLCFQCNRPNTGENWCKVCNSEKFRQDFDKWTSGNENIDKFIQEAQLNANNNFELLEWIPYNRLRNIKLPAQGEFVYYAIWLDGWIDHLDYEKQEWRRIFNKLEQAYNIANDPNIRNPLQSNENYGQPVALKNLSDSSDINYDFLNEYKEWWSNDSYLIPLLGITQDPDKSNYMIVTPW
ncbi:hypothetical protein C1645_764703 [Glomus cerebriforme]|uniref:Uncharacterized protein n=1 Tax=Glomus cerebriforme TaxID=658196 RepID=A0A397TC96_9GLOM|nr:hypothetical protein C1645_764703 [Glomus cerebriforme]